MNSLLLNGTAYGTLPAIVDPADGITAITPTSLSALVIKNGTDTADSVTITAVGGGRTGVYKWSYSPSGEAEGDQFSIVFTITIASADHYQTVDLIVKAPQRGTDGASTHTAADAANAVVGKSEFTSLASDAADAKTATETTIPNLIQNINQSASRRVTLSTSANFEIPDSGSSSFTIEMRTYDGDGAPVTATGSPSLAVNGASSGDLSAQLSAATNPTTGVYRWVFTLDADDTVEQIWFDASAVLPDGTFTDRAFSNIADSTAVDFTQTDRAKLDSILSNFPTNFSVLAINSSGHVERVVLVDTTTANSDMRGTNNASTFNHTQSTVQVGSYANGQIPIREGVEYNHVASSDNETRAATITPV